MRECIQAPARPPVGSYRRIPYFALRGMFQMRGYKDQEVAEAIGINPGTLSGRMRGHSEWKSTEITAICELLDIPQDEIGKFFFPHIKGGTTQ